MALSCDYYPAGSYQTPILSHSRTSAKDYRQDDKFPSISSSSFPVRIQPGGDKEVKLLQGRINFSEHSLKLSTTTARVFGLSVAIHLDLILPL